MNATHVIFNNENATINTNKLYQSHNNSAIFTRVRIQTDIQTGGQTNQFCKHFSTMSDSVKK